MPTTSPPDAPTATRPLVTVHLPANFALVVKILEAVVALVPDAQLGGPDPQPGQVVITVPEHHAGFADGGGA